MMEPPTEANLPLPADRLHGNHYVTVVMAVLAVGELLVGGRASAAAMGVAAVLAASRLGWRRGERARRIQPTWLLGVLAVLAMLGAYL